MKHFTIMRALSFYYSITTSLQLFYCNLLCFRLILDADTLPMVVPFVHTGMQDIMPVGASVPRIGKTVSISKSPNFFLVCGLRSLYSLLHHDLYSLMHHDLCSPKIRKSITNHKLSDK